MDLKKPHLLLTNDDGIEAEGLKALIDALRDRFRLTVIAPVLEKSGSAMSMTLREPLYVKKVHLFEEIEAYSVTGTPTDCIKLGIGGGIAEKPDLIVSGINPGTNAGRNILYSGTVGAAIQGVLAGIQSVAFSMRSFTDPNYSPALSTVVAIITYLIAHPLPEGTLLNVNFPSLAPYKGLKWTRQGRGVWKEAPHTPHDLKSGEAMYMLGHQEYLPEEEDGDTQWLSQGYITLVPVKVGQMTDHSLLEERKNVRIIT
jgi:5'-nucleotidase